MRFFLNRASHEQALSETLGVVYSNAAASSPPDTDYPDHDDGTDNNETQQDTSSEEDEEDPENAANERSPINRLPNELLEYIFELQLAVYSRSHMTRPDSIALGVDAYWVFSVRDENIENADRTNFLNKVGLVCRGWLSVAGRLSCKHVVVDGLPQDYERASKALRNCYPGFDCTKGSLVRYLRVDINEDYVYDDTDLVNKVITVLTACPNLQKLIVRNESGLSCSAIQDIWKEGIQISSSSLEFLAWNVAKLDAIATNIPLYLQGFGSLTELALSDQDVTYTLKECDSISLPELRTYRLRALHSAILRYQASWNMSSLVNFSLCFEESRQCASEPEIDKGDVDVFFKAHGPHLRFLQLSRLPTDLVIMTAVLDSAPNLEHLDVDINLLCFESGFLRHDNINFIKISGARIDEGINGDKSVGTYMTRFVTSLRVHGAFPRVTHVMKDYLSNFIWAEGFHASHRSEWQKWFALEETCRPLIVDEKLRPLKLEDVVADVDRSFRIRRI